MRNVMQARLLCQIEALGIEIKAALAGVSRADDDPNFGTADMELAKTLISKRMGLRVLAGLRAVTLPPVQRESALLAA